jgi:drug/metabolite transporter (DMT)-like permease
MGEFLAILALVLFSVNIVITKVASARLNLKIGFLISMTVNVIFAAFLLSLQYIFTQKGLHWNSNSFFLFMLSGFFATYLGRFLFFKTIETLGPAKASAFQVSNPIFTAVIAWIFLKEALSGVDMIAISIMLMGLFYVSYTPITASAGEKEIAATKETLRINKITREPFLKTEFVQKGVLIALLSALSYAVSNVLRGAAIRDWNEPILGALIGAVLGVILHLIFSGNTRLLFKQLRVADRKGTILYICSGILTISAQSSMIASMRFIPVTITNLITLSTPVLVTPLSYFLLKNQEGITKRTIIGIGMVLFAISIIVLL